MKRMSNQQAGRQSGVPVCTSSHTVPGVCVCAAQTLTLLRRPHALHCWAFDNLHACDCTCMRCASEDFQARTTTKKGYCGQTAMGLSLCPLSALSHYPLWEWVVSWGTHLILLPLPKQNSPL